MTRMRALAVGLALCSAVAIVLTLVVCSLLSIWNFWEGAPWLAKVAATAVVGLLVVAIVATDPGR